MYPLVNVYIAMENGPFTADLPLKNVIFQFFLYVYQRVMVIKQ
jgi:hypothetical protein